MFIGIGTSQIRNGKGFNFAAAFGDCQFAFFQETSRLFDTIEVRRIE